eukprot:m.4850 g.4850  ORF g.4850 m.4850 type:complete len:60 (-) comp3117_c0_seq1:2078-2257(-)
MTTRKFEQNNTLRLPHRDWILFLSALNSSSSQGGESFISLEDNTIPTGPLDSLPTLVEL